MDYGLHVNLREGNIERISEFEELSRRGMPSFKFYMTYDTYKVSDDVLFVAHAGGGAARRASRSSTPRTT